MDGFAQGSCRRRNPPLQSEMWGTRIGGAIIRCGPPVSCGPPGSFNVSASYDAKNRITTGYSYDAAGNMTNDGFHSYTYDAEGNILTVDGGSNGQYVYDALNRRVSVKNSNSNAEFLFDTAGRRISTRLETGNTGYEGRIYWDGQQIGFRSIDGDTYFEHQDYLGTERMRTDYAGAVGSSYTSLPWGDGYLASVNEVHADQDNLHFATLDQDVNTVNAAMSDHAEFRNYSHAQGRWLAPDSYTGSYDLTNPQSFNRYAYVLNNPLSLLDPTGQDCYVISDDTWSISFGDGNASNTSGTDPGTWVCTDPGSWPCQEYGYCQSTPSGTSSGPALAPSNCGITVKCRGIQTKNLGKLGFQHCDAQVTNSAGATHSDSGGPVNSSDPSVQFLNAWDTSPPTGPFTGTTVYQGSSCTAASCIINSTQQWNNDPIKPVYNPFLGPNSNTWLKDTFSGCGVSLSINTWGSIF